MISLRPYQNAAIASVLEAYNLGTHRQAVQLPTGAGKTVVFCSLCQQRGGRSLILAHRDELISQAQDKMRMVAPELGSGIVKAERNETGYQVTVASVQTLARTSRLAGFPQDWDTVIVDEAHHTAADSYRRILDHVVGPQTLLLGVSATLERSDGRGMDDIYDAITYSANMLDLMRSGYLCDIKALEIGLKINTRLLHKRGGDYVDHELADALEDANAPSLAVEAWEKHALGRKTLLFAPTVDSTYQFAEAFTDAGYTSAVVHGATPTEERRDILRRFSRGEITILCNCMVLTEGYDEPTVECIIMARPTCSKPLYIQMLGRGTRTNPGKDNLLVLDLVAVSSKVGDLMSTATLFGTEPQAGKDHEAKDANGDDADVIGVLDGLEIVKEQEQAVQLAGELVAREVELFRRRDIHWGVSEGVYTLTAGTDGLLVVRQYGDDSLYSVVRHYREKDPFEQYPRDKIEVLRTGLDVGYAQGFCEDYVRQVGARALVSPNAPWRKKAPTEKQLAFAKRIGVKVPEGATSGQVSDLIDQRQAERLNK